MGQKSRAQWSNSQDNDDQETASCLGSSLEPASPKNTLHARKTRV